LGWKEVERRSCCGLIGGSYCDIRVMEVRALTV
jgi:hypothetical protein